MWGNDATFFRLYNKLIFFFCMYSMEEKEEILGIMFCTISYYTYGQARSMVRLPTVVPPFLLINWLSTLSGNETEGGGGLREGGRLILQDWSEGTERVKER